MKTNVLDSLYNLALTCLAVVSPLLCERVEFSSTHLAWLVEIWPFSAPTF